MSLVEGATFNGKIDMDGDPAASVSDSPADRPSDDAVAAKDEPATATSDDAVAAKDKPAAEKRSAAKKSNRTDKKSANAA